MDLEFTFEYDNLNIKDITYPRIFLAGPVVRGSSFKDSWRYEAINILEKLDFPGGVFIPEEREWNESELDEKYIEKMHVWEWDHLAQSDIILFWIPRNIKNGVYGYTTNIEFGYWISYDPYKVVLGHPKDADMMEYIDDLYNKIGPGRLSGPLFKEYEYKITYTLKDTIIKAMKILSTRYKSINKNFDKINDIEPEGGAIYIPGEVLKNINISPDEMKDIKIINGVE